MDTFLGLGPLVLLLIGIVWLVSRGTRHGPHDRGTGSGNDSDAGD